MAFSRHNIEKRRLIELVRINPILWDCRLPHYKRSDKKKAVKWSELGRIFSVNGERVQRTFTSLREIFRRELNHEKLLGSRFKSKWEYYDAMSFLKEVIRERKCRERTKPADEQQQQLNNNNSSGIDEYQYFAPNDPNNPKNQPQAAAAAAALPPQPLTTAAGATTAPPPLPLPLLPLTSTQPDIISHLNANTLSTLQLLSAAGVQASVQSPQALSTSRSCSSSPSIYIKDEPDSQDDTISLSTLRHGKTDDDSPKMLPNPGATKSTPNDTHTLAKSNQLSQNASKVTSKSLLHSGNNLIIDEDLQDLEADLDDDPDVDMMDEHMSPTSSLNMVKHHHPTPREILYTKFGEFLAARLNTLNETIANDLMNKILLLIAEK